jgi:integrase/recombinase XerC
VKNQIIDFILYLSVERQYSIHTQQAYERDILQLLDFLEVQKINRWQDLNEENLNLFIIQLRHTGVSARSIRRYMSSIRNFLTYLTNQNQLDNNCAAQLRTPKMDKKLPETLDYDQLLQLLNVKTGVKFERRDVAMIETIYSSGLRVSELVGLNKNDVDNVQGFVKIIGKGGKTRHTPLGKSAQKAIAEYAATHDKTALFINQNGNRIGVRTVQNIIKKRALVAGIKINVYPHMLRHAAATHFLQSSHDLRSAQEFLGHDSIRSTQIYAHLDFLELSKVYDKCHPHAKTSK